MGAPRTEKRRKMTVTAKRRNGLADKLTMNLMQPRKAKFEGDWDSFIKKAVSQSVKVAAEFVESDRLRDIIDRIAADYERSDIPLRAGGNEVDRKEWVDWVMKDPKRIGIAASTWGSENQAGITRQMGTEIGGYELPEGFGGKGRKPVTAKGMAEYFTDPDSRELIEDAYFERKFGRQYGYQPEAWRKVQRDMRIFETTDAAGNVLATLGSMAKAKIPGLKPLEFAAMVAGPAVAASMPHDMQAHRPMAERWYDAVESELDLIETKDQIKHLTKQYGANSAQVASAKQNYENIRQKYRQQAVAASKTVPYDDQLIHANWKNTLTTAMSGANMSFNKAVAPGMMTAFDAFNKYSTLEDSKKFHSGYTVAPLTSGAIEDGWVLAEDFQGIPAGTPMTNETRQKLRGLGAEKAPMLRAPLWGEIRSKWGGLSELYVGLRSSQMLQREVGNQLMQYAASAKRLGNTTRAGIAERLGTRLFGAGPKAAPGRIRRAGQAVTNALKGVAKRSDTLTRLYRGAQAAKAGAAGRLSRLFRLTKPKAASDLGRAMTAGRAARGIGRAAGTAMLMVEGAKGYWDAAEALFTDHGKEMQNALTREYARATHGKGKVENFLRGAASIPEAVFGDPAYLKGMVGYGTNKALAPYTNKMYNDQIRRELLLTREFESSMKDLRKILPEFQDPALYSMATNMAIDRAATQMSPAFRNKQVSREEHLLLQKEGIRDLPQQQKTRVRQLVRAVGPAEFMNMFFFENDAGDVVPDLAAWQSLRSNAHVPLPKGYGYYDNKVSWNNRYAEEQRKEDIAISQERYKVNRVARQAEAEANRQKSIELTAKRTAEREAVQAEHRAFREKWKSDLEKRRQRSAQLLEEERKRFDREMAQQEKDREAYSRLTSLDPVAPKGPTPPPTVPQMPEDMVAQVARRYGLEPGVPTQQLDQPPVAPENQPAAPSQPLPTMSDAVSSAQQMMGDLNV